MGTLNLGNNGIINGVVKKPGHPYLLCQANTNQDVNNNTNTIITSLFGNTRISQGGLSYNKSHDTGNSGANGQGVSTLTLLEIKG